MKTIKQISDELGVSKQAVRNQIAKLGLQSSLRKNGNQFAINEQEEMAIIKAFSKESQTESQSKSQTESQSKSQTESQSTLHSALRLLEKQNEQLSNELTIKNKQIDELSTSLRLALEQSTAAQALHAGTIQQQFLTNGGTELATDKNKWWRFWDKP